VLSSGYYDAYYSRAQKLRTLILRDFTEAYKKCDVLLTPATPGPAFGVGEKTADPLAMYLNDIFTVTVNLAGLPGLAVPAGLTASGLPLGLQIIGKAFDEATVLRAGRAIERASGFNAKPAKWWSAP
jgi:aspartyl-tRNA(Asn)/glutamyl-tRNA(Gln) amidotransferase subunit A